MAAIEKCTDELINVSRVSENGSEGENSLFFETDKDFVQIDDDGNKVTKKSFSMGLQGMLQRIEIQDENGQDLFDYIAVATLNTPHKYSGVGQALYAVLGKTFTAKVTRELIKKGQTFEGFEMPSDRFVTTKLVVTKSKAMKFAEKFISMIKPKEISITI